MTFEFGIGMLAVGMIAIFIGAVAALYIINNFVIKKKDEPTRFDDLE
jgi:hypothetical protein